MKVSRRNFLGLSALAGLSGCARIEQTKLGKITPEFEFGDDGVLKIAALNDLHMLDSRGAGIVGRAVNLINNDDAIDFTLVLGDLTTHGTLPEANLALQALDRLEKPYFCIPGEHDYNPATENHYEFYQRAFKKTQWRESSAGWVLIGLDTCDGTASQTTVSQSSLDWLKDQLEHTEKKKPIALFTHHPLSPNTKADRATNADDVLALFADHHLKLVASGHYHGNQEEERDGVLFVTTACCSATAENSDGTTEKGYRVFTLEGESIQHEFIPVA
jgi:3',5'-cyclic AMP phosphodiesterase CpdA